MTLPGGWCPIVKTNLPLDAHGFGVHPPEEFEVQRPAPGSLAPIAAEGSSRNPHFATPAVDDLHRPVKQVGALSIFPTHFTMDEIRKACNKEGWTVARLAVNVSAAEPGTSAKGLHIWVTKRSQRYSAKYRFDPEGGAPVRALTSENGGTDPLGGTKYIDVVSIAKHGREINFAFNLDGKSGEWTNLSFGPPAVRKELEVLQGGRPT
jgi:hypothetical protein